WLDRFRRYTVTQSAGLVTGTTVMSERSAGAAAALLVGLLAPAAALAQDEESEIVVTAPIEGSRIESLQGAEVLRRDDIVAHLHGGLGDTLDAAPGVATTFFGAGA